LRIQCSRDKHTLVVDIEGELDHHTSDVFRDKVDNALKDPTIKNIVYDLSHLKFMDSSGVGVFIGRYKIISRRGGVAAAAGLKPQIHKVFEVSGLYTIIKKYNDVQEALADIRGVR
jgi:stage II sporulation protein AA (anti-sigma F factor antagonist)